MDKGITITKQNPGLLSHILVGSVIFQNQMSTFYKLIRSFILKPLWLGKSCIVCSVRNSHMCFEPIIAQ